MFAPRNCTFFVFTALYLLLKITACNKISLFFLGRDGVGGGGILGWQLFLGFLVLVGSQLQCKVSLLL